MFLFEQSGKGNPFISIVDNKNYWK